MATKNVTKAADAAPAPAPEKAAAKPAAEKKAAPAKAKPEPVPEPEVATAEAEVEGGEEGDEAESGLTYGRKEIAESVRASLANEGIGITSKIALAAVTAFEGVVAAIIAEGNDVVLPGFGKFKVGARPGGPRRNPKTGETFVVDATFTVAFKPGKVLKDAVTSRGIPVFETEPAAEEAAS